MRRLSKNAGFTLVELMVVMAILTVVFGITIPTYRDFQSGQLLSQATQTLKTNLRFAQSQALAGVKPSDCAGTLVGWYLRMADGGNSYQIRYRCGITSAPYNETASDHLYQTAVSLPSGVTFDLSQANVDVLFQPVNQGTAFPTNAAADNPPFPQTSFVITLDKSTKTNALQISSTGDLAESSSPPGGGGGPTPTSVGSSQFTPTPIIGGGVPTPTSLPTATPGGGRGGTPTPTKVPPPTPKPTLTPRPTATPAPTATPKPTGVPPGGRGGTPTPIP